MKVNLIVAGCKVLGKETKVYGIGNKGQLPWRLKNEMKFFAKMTTTTKDTSKKNAVIMGRKTWESIPEKFRPLKNRFNLILTRNATYDLKTDNTSDVAICSSLNDAMELLKNNEGIRSGIEDCWIIGGSSVYDEAFKNNLVDRIYFTEVMADFEVDTFFPEINREKFTEVLDDPDVPNDIQEENGIKYQYKVFENRF